MLKSSPAILCGSIEKQLEAKERRLHQLLQQNSARIRGVEVELELLNRDLKVCFSCLRFCLAPSSDCQETGMATMSHTNQPTDRAETHTPLQMTSGPKRAAVEFLRGRIEAASERVAAARGRHDCARAALADAA